MELRYLTTLLAALMFGGLASVGFKNELVLFNMSHDTQVNPLLLSKKSDLETFMIAISHRESRGNYKAVNAQGMMGKYQFSRSTLKTLRKDITPKMFLNNPYVQDTVMHMYLQVNNNLLSRFIDQFEGKVYKGVKITRSGILAAAHLGGAGSVISWFRNDDATGLVDANGTSIREYMTTFSKYPISRSL